MVCTNMCEGKKIIGCVVRSRVELVFECDFSSVCVFFLVFFSGRHAFDSRAGYGKRTCNFRVHVCECDFCVFFLPEASSA